MVFDPARPDITVRVRWFFVDEPGVPPPGPTAFFARDYWSFTKEWHTGPLGEVYLSDRINSGKRPTPDPCAPGFQGPPLGTPGQLLHGVPWVNGRWGLRSYLSVGWSAVFWSRWLAPLRARPGVRAGWSAALNRRRAVADLVASATAWRAGFAGVRVWAPALPLLAGWSGALHSRRTLAADLAMLDAWTSSAKRQRKEAPAAGLLDAWTSSAKRQRKEAPAAGLVGGWASSAKRQRKEAPAAGLTLKWGLVVQHQRKEVMSVSAKGQFTATLTGVTTVTPTGGCGSLPTTMVCRFSGFGGTCAAALNGSSCNLSYNSGSQAWTGSFTPTGLSVTTVSVGCQSGSFKGSLGGGVGGGPVTFTGTKGANPNLTGTLSPTSGCSGSGTMTLTRT